MIYLIAAAATVIFILMIWGFVLKYNNPSIMDVGWSLGIIINTLVYFYFSEKSLFSIIALVVILAWGVRLAGTLFYHRVYHKIMDTRYQRLSENWANKYWGYLQNFLFQGLLIWLFSLTSALLFLHFNPTLPVATTLLLVLALLSLANEALADAQLNQFKHKPTGKVCQQGWWYYSRHPNYFFDWFFWLCLSVLSFLHATHWLCFSAVVVLYLVMNRLTIPISEATSLTSRGDVYAAYQQRTNSFFPWFPKSS